MSTASTSTRSERIQLPVRIQGRLYPTPLAESSPPGSIDEIDSRPGRVSQQLSRSLLDRLPFFAAPTRQRTAEWTEAYVESLQALERFRRQLEELIPHLCEANLAFRQEAGETAQAAADKVLAKKFAEMSEKTRFYIRRAENIVDADLLAQPAEEAAEKLEASLRSNVARFVADFFQALDRLVDQQIAGLVEWKGRNACCYHFFREVVIQDLETTTQRSNGRYADESSPTGWTEQIVTTHEGTHTHRLARHEHHAIDAFQTSIANSKVVMPQAVQQFVENIPDWLAPIVRVIDAKLAREIIIERDLKTETWTSREVRDIPVFGGDPAVVIDHIVLTGWGSRDIDAELARRKEQSRREVSATQEKRARWAVPASRALGIGISLLSLWLFAKASTLSAMAIALLTLLLALPCWIFASLASSSHKQRPIGRFQPLRGALGFTAVFAGIGLLLGMGLGSLPVLISSAGLTLVGLATLFFPG